MHILIPTQSPSHSYISGLLKLVPDATLLVPEAQRANYDLVHPFILTRPDHLRPGEVLNYALASVRDEQVFFIPDTVTRILAVAEKPTKLGPDDITLLIENAFTLAEDFSIPLITFPDSPNALTKPEAPISFTSAPRLAFGINKRVPRQFNADLLFHHLVAFAYECLVANRLTFTDARFAFVADRERKFTPAEQAASRVEADHLRVGRDKYLQLYGQYRLRLHNVKRSR